VALVSPGAADGSKLTDSAAVSSTTTDNDSNNNTATFDTTVSAADLAVTLTAPGGVIRGDTVTYAVAVTKRPASRPACR
jgi:hypothetical protein